MLGVAAFEIFFDVEVGRLPEAFKASGDLDRAAGGGQKVQGQGDGSARDGWRVYGAEHFLESYGKDRGLAGIIGDRDSGAAGDRDMGGRQTVEGSPLVPGKQRGEGGFQIEAGEMASPGDP